nr:hypothetical protein [Opitutales bacterium]
MFARFLTEYKRLVDAATPDDTMSFGFFDDTEVEATLKGTRGTLALEALQNVVGKSKSDLDAEYAQAVSAGDKTTVQRLLRDQAMARGLLHESTDAEGKVYAYASPDNKKLLDATYDNEGKLIPLSERFVTGLNGKRAVRNNDPRYSLPAQQTEEEIEIQKRAFADGTFMKAPNGKASNLNEHQWLRVRTRAFKFAHFVGNRISPSFFGAWDLKNKSVNIVELPESRFADTKDVKEWVKNSGILGIMTDPETNGKGEIAISTKSVHEMLNGNQQKKSVSREIHFAAITKLRDIIRESEITDVHEDFKKGEDGTRSAANGMNPNVLIEILHGAVSVGGEIYRVKTTLKQYAPKMKTATKAYAYEIEEIEVLAGQQMKRASIPANSITSIPMNILLDGVRNVNGKLTLEDHSKVLDENGEPLVVWHGTDAEFNVFDASKSRAGMDIQGNFFTPSKEDAEGYGKNVRAFFLNIRKPANGAESHDALATFKGQNYAGTKARELLKEKGFDGVNNDGEEFITFDAVQTKSATDNIGTYDVRDNRFKMSLPYQIHEAQTAMERWRRAVQNDIRNIEEQIEH